MKPLPLIALALALPGSAAATVAMEAQQTTRSETVVRSAPPAARVHRPLFIVKYVLRPAPSDMPQILMDDQEALIVPPAKDVPSAQLGALRGDPNMVVCFGWGCEPKP